ncbi:MAG: iron-containing alcohol dehydrogenase [Bryobacteraceae bacterium]|nr:iron-containing alcohol dehydrogenase [Bryobacteraceae bacterium]MCX7603094.1 iron-containing alcohol dehydrogenase [Bryobacteraceae bacterium]
MTWEFATARRVLFGAGAAREIAPAARGFGKRALLVTGRNPRHAARLVADLHKAGVGCTPFPTEGEPTLDTVRAGVETARREGCDLVIACGGGSALDAGKAMAAMLANPGDVLDYLEVIGGGQPLPHEPAPFIAVPTTAGTGSEATRNAVLHSPGHGVKASLRSPSMLPRLAVVDPELTLSVPPAITAATGLDALAQLLEPFVSVRANPMTDMFCREGLRRAGRSLLRAFHHGEDLDARTDMALASLLSGMALANAGLGAVHGFAAPIGGSFPAPHGAVCAALLPAVVRANLKALRERAPGSPALERYAEAARILCGEDADADRLAQRLDEIRQELGIPRLSAYGIAEEHLPALCEKAARASSMKGNPVALTGEELAGILREAL